MAVFGTRSTEFFPGVFQEGLHIRDSGSPLDHQISLLRTALWYIISSKGTLPLLTPSPLYMLYSIFYAQAAWIR